MIEARRRRRCGEETVRTRQHRRLKVMSTLAVTYLFIAQLLLGSRLPAQSAAEASGLDRFGNPRCLTHRDQSPDHGDSQKLPECCTQACSALSPALPFHATTGFLFNSLADSEVLGFERQAETVERPETYSGFPRGPPGAV